MDHEYVLTLRERSISVGLDDRITVAADRSGRLYSYFREGAMFRRALNGHVMRKWHDREGRHSLWLEPGERDRTVDEAAGLFASTLDDMGRPGWRWMEAPPSADVLEIFVPLVRRAASYDATTASRDAARFDAVYGTVGILPPDHYLSLVLHATEGCSFNSCTFCTLYAGEPYRVKTREEFRGHIGAVRDFFGDGLSLRERTVFLGAANALAVPLPRLEAFFDEIADAFGVPSRGVHGFVDGFTGERKSAADYVRLREKGLKRVYIGLESGHDPLLEHVRKPSRAAQVLETATRLREAGVSVAPIVIVGLGGRRYAQPHVADTLAVLNAMRLGPGDLIFFSDLVEPAGAEWPAATAMTSGAPLDAGEIARQRSLLLSGLEFSGPRPKVADYDIREFIY